MNSINNSNNQPSFGMSLSVSKDCIRQIAKNPEGKKEFLAALPKLKELSANNDVFITANFRRDGLSCTAFDRATKDLEPINNYMTDQMGGQFGPKVHRDHRYEISTVAKGEELVKEGGYIDAVKKVLEKLKPKEVKPIEIKAKPIKVKLNFEQIEKDAAEITKALES